MVTLKPILIRKYACFIFQYYNLIPHLYKWLPKYFHNRIHLKLIIHILNTDSFHVIVKLATIRIFRIGPVHRFTDKLTKLEILPFYNNIEVKLLTFINISSQSNSWSSPE